MATRRATPSRGACSAEVVQWRRDRLLEAGFTPSLATELAERHDIDLHALLDLIDRGCPPGLAARILAPLDEPLGTRHRQ